MSLWAVNTINAKALHVKTSSIRASIYTMKGGYENERCSRQIISFTIHTPNNDDMWGYYDQACAEDSTGSFE